MQTIAEMVGRVRLALSGGYPTIYDRVQDPEIRFALQDAINAVLKTSVFETNFTFDGGTIPDGVVYATYTGQEIIDYQGKRAVLLPCIPWTLPEGAGVWSVYPDDEMENEFVPVRPGQGNILSLSLDFSDINTMGTYTWQGAYLYLTPAGDEVLPEKITVVLCVADISSLAATDPVPLSPELSDAVIRNVLTLLGADPGARRAPADNDDQRTKSEE